MHARCSWDRRSRRGPWARLSAPTARQTAPAWQEPVWQDPARPVDERVAALLGEMTLEEKLAQLASIWMGAAGGVWGR